jgi:hypothetical protein
MTAKFTICKNCEIVGLGWIKLIELDKLTELSARAFNQSTQSTT